MTLCVSDPSVCELGLGNLLHILKNRGSIHTRTFRPIHFSAFKYRWTKNGFTGPKSFRGFRETGPRPQLFKGWITLSTRWIATQWIISVDKTNQESVINFSSDPGLNKKKSKKALELFNNHRLNNQIEDWSVLSLMVPPPVGIWFPIGTNSFLGIWLWHASSN